MSFNLLIKKIKKKNNELRFMVIGLDNSGKTTIINSLFGKQTTPSPTFGYTIYKNTYNDVDITFLDIGGQESLRKYWSNFYEDIDGVIFVFDVFDTRDFVDEFNTIRETLTDYPILMYGNKLDLDWERGKHVVDLVQARVSTDNNVRCFGVSGKMGINLTDGMNWLMDIAKFNLAKELL